MAVAIDATVGGASANSYVTLAEAATYMEARLNSDAWDNATTDEQNRALVEATRELDVMAWDGDRVTDTQALAWPRQWVVSPDDPYGNYYSTTVIPTRVQIATSELAFQFLKAGTTDVAGRDTTDGVIRKKVDVLETEYASPGQRTTMGLARFPRVWNYIQPLLSTTATGATIPVVRG